MRRFRRSSHLPAGRATCVVLRIAGRPLKDWRKDMRPRQARPARGATEPITFVNRLLKGFTEMPKIGRFVRAADGIDVARYGALFALSYCITLVAYGYMVTTIIFTNHTLPNAWVYPYPSFKTHSEGRWFADILIQLGGGSGVQLVQAVIGIAIVTVNGLLFATLLKLTDRLHVFLVTVLISLHPAFFDYYSFTVDHVTFALGDTLALAGVLALDRVRRRPVAVTLAVVAFALAIASYQPKISLVAVLLIVWCLMRLARPAGVGGTEEGGLPATSEAVSCLATAASVFLLSVALYLLTLMLSLSAPDPGARTHVNTLGEALGEAFRAYPETARDFTTRVAYLPQAISHLPGIAILVGAALYLWSLRDKGAVRVVAAIVVLLAVPIAAQLTYILNAKSWDAGRILSSHAYLLAFFLSTFLVSAPFRAIGTTLLGILAYFFFIVNSQGANYAAMKSIFDIGKVNRIASRIEAAVPDLYERVRPVVIVGNLEGTSLERLRWLRPDPYVVHTETEMFAAYRQVDILNFFFGSDVVERPSVAEIELAVASASGRRPWPAPEAVYVKDDVIVILLETPNAGVDMTWPRSD